MEGGPTLLPREIFFPKFERNHLRTDRLSVCGNKMFSFHVARTKILLNECKSLLLRYKMEECSFLVKQDIFGAEDRNLLIGPYILL